MIGWTGSLSAARRVPLLQPPAVHVADEVALGGVAREVLDAPRRSSPPARRHRRGRIGVGRQLAAGSSGSPTGIDAVVRRRSRGPRFRAVWNVSRTSASRLVPEETQELRGSSACRRARRCRSSFRCAMARLEHGADVGPVGEEEGRDVDQDLARVPHGGDGERLGHRVAEGVGHGPRHRCAGRGCQVRVHRPELDPVALAVEADQVGAERGAAVEAELADALRELGDEQVVAIELRRGEREVDAVALEVDGEDAGADLAALGDLAERPSTADRPAAPRRGRSRRAPRGATGR